jgi:hypothetical protein
VFTTENFVHAALMEARFSLSGRNPSVLSLISVSAAKRAAVMKRKNIEIAAVLLVMEYPLEEKGIGSVSIEGCDFTMISGKIWLQSF